MLHENPHLIGAQGNKHITTSMSMAGTVFWINTLLHNFYFPFQPFCISAVLCVAKFTPPPARGAGAKGFQGLSNRRGEPFHHISIQREVLHILLEKKSPHPLLL